MFKQVFLTALIVSAAPISYAQFGSGVVYDPTQSTHAVIQIKNEEQSIANEAEQIQEGQKIFTNTVKLADNAIATYNLAHQMAMTPRNLYQPFLSTSTYWMELNRAANTYGNSSQWTTAVNTGRGCEHGVPASLHTDVRPDQWLRKPKPIWTTTNRGAGGHSRYQRRCNHEQYANPRNDPNELPATPNGHKFAYERNSVI